MNIGFLPQKQRLVFCVSLLWIFLSSPAFAANNLAEYDIDLQKILASRRHMEAIVTFIDANSQIFSNSTGGDVAYYPTSEERLIILRTWQSFLDHVLFFDTMGGLYAEAYLQARDKAARSKAFAASFASFLAQYRFCLDYIERMERNPNLHVILNEALPEMGLKANTYSLVKFRFLNVIRGAQFASLAVFYTLYKEMIDDTIRQIIDQDLQTIWAAGKGKGPLMTVQNGAKILQDLGSKMLFPVQKSVSELMGEIKVKRRDKALITSEQIEQLARKIRPGDILLQRREWYASNVGIPGFWTHAALYIGTPKERAEYFQDVTFPQQPGAKGGNIFTLNDVLQNRYPDRYLVSTQSDTYGHVPRVLEAIGEGVTFTTLEHSAAADSIAVLRPNLSRVDVAQAIIRSYHYSGRPYDFNFDFRTDAELVCSELIYKAYQKSNGHAGLDLPLFEVVGRPLISPNEIARLFDNELKNKEQQLHFVSFLDGREKEELAVQADVESFRQSWKRPKWHVWFQEPAGTM